MSAHKQQPAPILAKETSSYIHLELSRAQAWFLTCIPPLLCASIASLAAPDGIMPWLGLLLAPALVWALVLGRSRFSSRDWRRNQLEERYLQLLATTQHGVWILNSKGSTEYVNQSLADLLGYPLEEMFGRICSDFCEIPASSTPPDIVKSLLEQRKDSIFRSFRCKDGQPLRVRISSRLLLNEKGGLIGTVQTIQASSITDSTLAKSDFEEPNVSPVAVFAGEVIHEIHNPLTIIAGKANQLKKMATRDSIDGPRMAATADDISRTVLRITRIIRGLRAYASGTDDEPFAKVGLQELVEETLLFAAERFQSQSSTVRIEIEPIAADLLLECRATQISQVILNLVNNAYDAVEGQPEAWVRIGVTVEATWLELNVTDSGLGIDPDLAKKIMKPFFTTKAVGKGTGLGLSICAGIAYTHRGTLQIDSSWPHTRFVLRIPQFQSHMELPAGSEQQAS